MHGKAAVSVMAMTAAIDIACGLESKILKLTNIGPSVLLVVIVLVRRSIGNRTSHLGVSQAPNWWLRERS